MAASIPPSSSQPPPLPAERHPPSARLVSVACRHCGRHLIDVIAGAEVWCTACRVWTLATSPATPVGQQRLPLHS